MVNRQLGGGGVFSLRNFGKRGAGGMEPANHGKGQEPTSKMVISYHTSGSKMGNASSLPFSIGYTMWGPGARGAKELGGLCPGNNSRDEAKHTTHHTPSLLVTHPPTPSQHSHDNTQTCTTRRLVCSSDRQGPLRFPARLGILLLPKPLPGPLPGILCMLHVQSFVGFSFFLCFSPVRVTSSFQTVSSFLYVAFLG